MNAHLFVVSDVLWQRLGLHLWGELDDLGASAKASRLFLWKGFLAGAHGAALARFWLLPGQSHDMKGVMPGEEALPGDGADYALVPLPGS